MSFFPEFEQVKVKRIKTEEEIKKQKSEIFTLFIRKIVSVFIIICSVTNSS